MSIFFYLNKHKLVEDPSYISTLDRKDLNGEKDTRKKNPFIISINIYFEIKVKGSI